jgi:hypothetical protein
MAVRFVLGKRGTISGAKGLLAGIGDEYDFARQDLHEFIFMAVPMPLAGPRTGRKLQKIDAEIRETAGISQSLANTLARGFMERSRIAGTLVPENRR